MRRAAVASVSWADAREARTRTYEPAHRGERSQAKLVCRRCCCCPRRRRLFCREQGASGSSSWARVSDAVAASCIARSAMNVRSAWKGVWQKGHRPASSTVARSQKHEILPQHKQLFQGVCSKPPHSQSFFDETGSTRWRDSDDTAVPATLLFASADVRRVCQCFRRASTSPDDCSGSSAARQARTSCSLPSANTHSAIKSFASDRPSCASWSAHQSSDVSSSRALWCLSVTRPLLFICGKCLRDSSASATPRGHEGEQVSKRLSTGRFRCDAVKLRKAVIVVDVDVGFASGILARAATGDFTRARCVHSSDFEAHACRSSSPSHLRMEYWAARTVIVLRFRPKRF